MPTYLLHGFRWSRQAIRIHIALYDLDDAAAEWVVAPATSITLLNSFYTLYDFLPPSHAPKLPPSPALPSPSVPSPSVRSPSGSTGDFKHIPVPPIPDDSPNLANGEPRRLLRKKSSFWRRNKDENTNGERPKTRDGGDRPKTRGGEPERPKTRGNDTQGRGSPFSPSTNGHSPFNGGPVGSSRISAPTAGPRFNDWSVVKLVEQYDPRETASASQPFAYVADYMISVDLSASLSEEMKAYEERKKKEAFELGLAPTRNHANGHNKGDSGNGMYDCDDNSSHKDRNDSVHGGSTNGNGHVDSETSSLNYQSLGLSARELRKRIRRLNWFEKLRDSLQKEGEIGWFVVYCGEDEERITSYDGLSQLRVSNDRGSSNEGEVRPKTPKSAGLRSLFSRSGRREEPLPMPTTPVPPVPKFHANGNGMRSGSNGTFQHHGARYGEAYV